ncbi:MAG TPA: hypothetical protein VLL25_16720 [Acidimicrobiales bacterium]|nr:hypothetical protein [Acidimicrobiales bacterium]
MSVDVDEARGEHQPVEVDGLGRAVQLTRSHKVAFVDADVSGAGRGPSTVDDSRPSKDLLHGGSSFSLP